MFDIYWFDNLRIHPKDAPSLKKAVPGAFSLEEHATIQTMVHCMLPSGEEPGAADTGVMDILMGVLGDQPAEQIAFFKSGLEHVNAMARSMFGNDLAMLPQASAGAVVTQVSTSPELTLFWYGLRNITMLCFYSIPEVYTSIGLPGPSIDEGGFEIPEDQP
jgi:hypothetical protein